MLLVLTGFGLGLLIAIVFFDLGELAVLNNLPSYIIVQPNLNSGNGGSVNPVAWVMPVFSSQVVNSFLSVPLRVVYVVLVFLVAFVVHRLAWTIADWMLNSKIWHSLFVWSTRPLEATRLGIKVPNPTMRVERQRTIQLLVASIISITAFTTAVMLSLAQFMSSGALAVITGLFTAAFGFGARTLIGDLLAGISNIFEDNFDVGEKN
jgi:small-conductance mechanosensitive channel